MRRVLTVVPLIFCLLNTAQAQGNFYLSGKGGISFLNISKTNSLSSGTDGWPDDLYTNDNVDSAQMLSAEAGYQWTRDSVWLPFYSVGINYSYGFPTAVNGTIDQYSLPEFENYNYQYQIQQQTYLAVIKADLYRWRCLMPYLMAGAGISFNKLKGYTEQALPDVTPRVSPAFSDRTTSGFSYALGAGFDYALQNNLWVSLGYQYNHHKIAYTGYGADTDMLTDTNYSTDRLQTNLSSNTVLLSITYFFDRMNNETKELA